MTAILSETFFVWFRVAIEILTGELRPETRIGRTLIQHCVRILPTPIYIPIWCTTTPDNKLTYLMTAYYIPNDGLLPTMHCFRRTKLASYTACCSVFSINYLSTLFLKLL